MGIQDRDYYWAKHNEAGKSKASDFENLINKKQRYQKPKKSSGNIGYLVMPALMLFALWNGADRLLKHKAAQQPAQPAISIPDAPAKPKTIEPISGGLLIKADRQGHFRGTVLINDVPMPFMIDTGATMTVIPIRMANQAGLVPGRHHRSNTAGGDVFEPETRVETLKIGNAVIKNLRASINDHLDEVLIGMNTLKYFNIIQSGNTMTLVANGSSPDDIERPSIVHAPIVAPMPIQPNTIAVEQPATKPEIKRPTIIKKTVTCDAHQVCTTKYSDH
ncbi:MAG: TIGR02281 family clan AA aspartic protease [Methylomonas sp.]|nr:TIGR02281 family clan AA aspartic protease [Methylomonas sp.]